MTHEEQQRYLIEELLKEDKRYHSLRVPDSDKEQKDLLRSLMNVRSPKIISKKFLDIQDQYLSEERDRRGIVDGDLLPPILTDKRIVLWQGDITRLKIDAIVNAANRGMCGCFYPLHSCIDNIVHSRSGIALRLYCADMMEKQGYEEPTGQAKITPAFNLPSRYILHTVGPIIIDVVKDRDRALLASCYESCLKLADENNIKSIAFCCISTGEFHFPNDLAAEIAIKTVMTYLNRGSGVQRVIFNVFKDIDREIYEKLLGVR